MTEPKFASLPDKTGRLVAVQYLRGLAAMLVVLHHAVHERAGFFSPLAKTADFGRPGVLIFFVISGFVMMHACRNEPVKVFARRRIIRVAPLYWVMTLVFFAIVFRNDLAAGDPLRRVPELLQSLFFIPHYHSGVTTEIWPILVPGWTLNFEMFFFLIFAIGIASGRPALVSVLILAGLILVGLVVTTQNPLIVTWTHSFLVLFIAGIGLAKLWQRTDFSSFVWLFPVGMALVLIAALGMLPEQWTHPAFYVAAVITVAGTLAIQDRSSGFESKILAAIGDASYSIYLSHTILMIFLFKALRALPLDGWLQFSVVLVLALAICAGAGILIYRFVEMPLTKLLRRRFDAV